MNIQAISGAATVAIVCAIVFLLAARSWQLLARVLDGQPNFADSIMSEAAQRFRDQLSDLSRDQATYLGTGLVFVVMYTAAMLFQGPELFDGYPEWQLYILLSVLLAAALFAFYRLLRTVLAWRQVRFVRDANIAVGHQLQRLAAGHGYAFHDVRTSHGVVDHVLIGQNGLYAISVVARRHFKKGAARLHNGELQFSNSEKAIPLSKITVAATRLAKEFRQKLGKKVRLRPVIAVPGWDVKDQTDSEHLLVNERTLPMMRGWRDQQDYLLNEDVDTLQTWLTSRCKRRP